MFVNYCFQFQKTNLKKKIGWGLGGGGGSKGVEGYVVWCRDVCVVACVVLPTTHTGVYVAH